MPTQDTNVIKLQVASTICNNNLDIARQLVSIAKEIKRGEWGELRIATIVMDSSEGVRRITLGPAGTCVIEVVGLLTWAAHKAIDGV